MNNKFKDVRITEEKVLESIQKNFRTNRNNSNRFEKGVYERFKQSLANIEVDKGIVNGKSR